MTCVINAVTYSDFQGRPPSARGRASPDPAHRPGRSPLLALWAAPLSAKFLLSLPFSSSSIIFVPFSFLGGGWGMGVLGANISLLKHQNLLWRFIDGQLNCNCLVGIIYWVPTLTSSCSVGIVYGVLTLTCNVLVGITCGILTVMCSRNSTQIVCICPVMSNVCVCFEGLCGDALLS